MGYGEGKRSQVAKGTFDLRALETILETPDTTHTLFHKLDAPPQSSYDHSNVLDRLLPGQLCHYRLCLTALSSSGNTNQSGECQRGLRVPCTSGLTQIRPHVTIDSHTLILLLAGAFIAGPLQIIHPQTLHPQTLLARQVASQRLCVRAMASSKSLSFELVEIDNPKELNFILGHGKVGREPAKQGQNSAWPTLVCLINHPESSVNKSVPVNAT